MKIRSPLQDTIDRLRAKQAAHEKLLPTLPPEQRAKCQQSLAFCSYVAARLELRHG